MADSFQCMKKPTTIKKNKNEKDPDAGKDWGQEQQGTTEDDMAGCHH